MNEKTKLSKPAGFFDTFERRLGPIKKNMHYCPGCGHGIIHKLIAEAIADFNMLDDTVIISPVGCSVFAYYYFDCNGISVPHGRAPAVATGISRADNDTNVISYQGDGDLGAIGFNNFIQAANRGENIAVIFVNNAIYGMTGGQMAPTTLPGQKTATSPYGRDVVNEGFPLKVAELTAALDAPVYVERVSLDCTKNIMKARAAIRKALKNMQDKKGFSLVECLSGCPVNLKLTAAQTDDFIREKMIPAFPLGKLKDVAGERKAIVRPKGEYDVEKVKQILCPAGDDGGKSSGAVGNAQLFQNEKRIKCAGFGGQGILSMALLLAEMANQRNLETTWLPSYGPEQRGGTANCSVVVGRNKVGSPVVDKDCDLLITMNQPSVEKFVGEVKDGGIMLCDTSTMEAPVQKNIKVLSLNASDIAKEMGNIKMANSVMLGALGAVLEKYYLSTNESADFEQAFIEAINKSFAGKAKASVIEANKAAYRAGKQAMDL